MTRVSVTIGVMSVLMPGLVSAFESGFYVGGNMAFASMDDDAEAAQGLEFSASSFSPIPFLELQVAGIDGLPFDGEDFGWGGQFGYRFNSYLDFEVGYADLGTFESGTSSTSANTGIAVLDISELMLATRLRYPMSRRWRPNLYLGVSRVNFNVAGEANVLVAIGTPPTVIVPFIEPYSPPDDETGYVLGLGIDWQVSNRLTIEVGYKHHATQVLPIDSVNLSVMLSL